MSDEQLSSDELAAIKAKVEQAVQVVIDLAAMAKLGTVHIPARDDDNDIVLTDALRGARRLIDHIDALTYDRDGWRREAETCHAIMEDVRKTAQKAVGDGEHRMTVDAAGMMSDRIGMLEKSVIALLENCQFETDAEGHVTRVEMDFHGAVHVFIPSQPWHDPMMAHIARLWSLVRYRGNPADFSYVAY